MTFTNHVPTVPGTASDKSRFLHKATTSQTNPRPQISNKLYTYPGQARATRHKTLQHKHHTTSQSHTPDPKMQSNCILAPACPGHPSKHNKTSPTQTPDPTFQSKCKPTPGGGDSVQQHCTVTLCSDFVQGLCTGTVYSDYVVVLCCVV